MIRSSLSITSKATLHITDACSVKSSRRAAVQCRKALTSTLRQCRSKSGITAVNPRSPSKATQFQTDHKIKITNGKNRGRRKQHRLVASTSRAFSASDVRYDNYPRTGFPRDNQEEEEKRLLAMRFFLDSLQLATANTTLSNNNNNNTTTSESSGSEVHQKSGEDCKAATPLVENENDVDTINDVHCAAEPSVNLRGEEISHSSSSSSSSTKEEPIVQSKPAFEEEKKIVLKSGKARSKKTNKPKERAADDVIDFDRLESDLRRSMYRKDLEKSVFLFRESRRNKQILPKHVVTDLFFWVTESDPAGAHFILQHYNSQYLHQEPKGASTSRSGGGIVDMDSITNKRRSFYKRMVNSISLLDPQHHNTRQMHGTVESLLNEIEEMDTESKRVLYPKLIVSLVSQRIATIGQYAHGLFESMVDEGFEMKAGWLNRLLSMSRYNRQDDVPFHDIIERLVRTPGGELKPESVLPAIQNMFPFTNTEAVCVALGAWLENFCSKGQNQGDDDDCNTVELLVPNPEHLVDLSTLESISTGAAQAGSSELVLLVWDVLEACNYSPTEIIYENTVIAFANDKGGLQQAFAAMASMKEDGFEPSRPLIRSFSSAIRLQRFLIGRARRMLIDDFQNEMTSLDNHHLLSLDSLNVILSSYAERGDPLDAVDILDLMTENDIEPNADSYSFVIEALGRDIKKRLKTKDHEYMQRNVDVANTILSMMEGKGAIPTTHVIRNYVELLCLAGETETATSIVEDYLSSSDPCIRNTINNITIYRVASQNASLGDVDSVRRARCLAEQMSECIPVLHRRIRSKEQRFTYLEETREAVAKVGGSKSV